MRSRQILPPSSLLCLALSLYGCIAAIDYARSIYVHLDSSLGNPEITITLDNSFIDKYKDRATVHVRLIVDQASRGPKPAFLDGDFHFSGRVAEIGLPVVAEIKNSAREKDAIDEVQGEEAPKLRYTNPDHVFEIHPVTAVQDSGTLDSFTPVPGYHLGDANDAFKNYERTDCTIIARGDKTSIITRKGEYNDKEKMEESREPPKLNLPYEIIIVGVYDAK